MTTSHLIVMASLYLAALVGVAYLTRAKVPELQEPCAAVPFFGVVAVLAVAPGREPGLVASAEGRLLALPVGVWLALAVSCTPVYLISWRAARRFGGRGLAVFALAAAVIGPARDYQVAAMFPGWITFSPGVVPILGVRTWLNRKLGKERRGQLHREFLEHAHRPRE